ncbi:MAG: hypothetical protein GWN01_17740, partial [Nitrosopumilaceae archaeon]|nr:hypothetical protein [Nitrosopumilaceae archaeon]NIU89119.1 hypothetical protein [Nitrosopumilaceae archaeon]NIV65316.1 hypothetical protein [Nitrosopumilaceae archaeon]NIX63265.1 hypothetical protein [Nitrosopumilaceae archaeon]
CTGQNIWMIHIQKDGSGKPVWNTSLGHLELHKKRDKAVGGGFKFLAYQAINGDRSDHYFGCKGVGPVLAVDLIKDCESEQEIIEKCLELYQETYGDLYEYTSWDGQEMKKTPIEMLQMHFEMPWMRDTPKGKPFDIYDYL